MRLISVSNRAAKLLTHRRLGTEQTVRPWNRVTATFVQGELVRKPHETAPILCMVPRNGCWHRYSPVRHRSPRLHRPDDGAGVACWSCGTPGSVGQEYRSQKVS